MCFISFHNLGPVRKWVPSSISIPPLSSLLHHPCILTLPLSLALMWNLSPWFTFLWGMSLVFQLDGENQAVHSELWIYWAIEIQMFTIHIITNVLLGTYVARIVSSILDTFAQLLTPFYVHHKPPRPELCVNLSSLGTLKAPVLIKYISSHLGFCLFCL